MQAPSGPEYPPQVSLTHPPTLARLERSIQAEALNCWLLVGMTSLGGGMLSVALTTLVPRLPELMPLAWGLEFPEWVLTMLPIVDVLGSGAVGVFATLLLAAHVYHQRYRAVSADLVWGQLALTLVDPDYGEQIEALRQEHYRPSMWRISLTSDLQGRLAHLAYFYPQYYKLSRGPSELAPTSPVPGNCWLDGGLLVMCSGCPLTLLLMVVRILTVYPRLLATKRAVLDYFSGKWDAALEQQYLARTNTSP